MDSQNAAIAGAEVRFDTLESPARTDPQGGVDVPSPPFTAVISAPGFESVRIRVTEETATVRLRPATLITSIEVTVRDEAAPAEMHGASIERTAARTALDAVEKIAPAAYVTRRGVMGYGIATNGTGGITIRGVGGQPNTGVLVVVDGRPDYQGLMGHPLPDFYSLSDAGAVNVTEGPASVLYGSNAMGGVVEVKPAQPRTGTTTRLTTGLGSFWTGQHRLSHGSRFERAYYSLNAGVSHTSGDRPSSAFRNQDGTGALGYDINDQWKASLHGRYGHFHVEDPGPASAPVNGAFARVGRGGFNVNLDNSNSRSWGYARAFSSHGHHIITDGFRSVDRTTGLRLDQSVAAAPGLTVQLGSDVVNYGGRARNVIADRDYGTFGATSAAGFARVQAAPFSRLRAHAGARYENNSIFGAIAVPEAGATIAFSRWSLTAAAGQGFRNPTIRELYLFPAPNPLLRPERISNYQFAVQAHPAPGLTASATVYYAALSNLIVVTGRYPNIALANAGGALNRGTELAVRWHPVRRMVVQSGYAYLRSTNLAPYIPGRKLDTSVELDAGRFFIHCGVTNIGERWADAAHGRRLGAYTNASLKLMMPFGRRASAFTMIENLLNRHYEVVAGYPMPGVAAASGFTVTF